MNNIRPEVTGRKSASSIDEFCNEHRISRALFYKLLKAGKGPRLMQVGSRKLISVEAAADWRCACESDDEASS